MSDKDSGVPRDDVVTRLRAAGCVFAEDEALLLQAEAADEADLDARVRRRCAGEPLEHVLGWAELAGVRVAVGPGVFVPRRRSELLVRAAVGLLPDRGVLVDLCCGCAAVGVAVATLRPGSELHASDVDPAAVTWARRNVALVGGAAYAGDLDAALPEGLAGRVDVLVANAPYVPTGSLATMPREAREHEPLVALDGGPDGTSVQGRVAACAPRWLAPRGAVLIETSDQQSPLTSAALRRAGLVAEVVTDSDLEATIVVGRRP